MDKPKYAQVTVSFAHDVRTFQIVHQTMLAMSIAGIHNDELRAYKWECLEPAKRNDITTVLRLTRDWVSVKIAQA